MIGGSDEFDDTIISENYQAEEQDGSEGERSKTPPVGLYTYPVETEDGDGSQSPIEIPKEIEYASIALAVPGKENTSVIGRGRVFNNEGRVAEPFGTPIGVQEELWVRGLKFAEVGFEFRDQSSNPSVCLITDDGLRKFVYLVT